MPSWIELRVIFVSNSRGKTSSGRPKEVQFPFTIAFLGLKSFPFLVFFEITFCLILTNSFLSQLSHVSSYFFLLSTIYIFSLD